MCNKLHITTNIADGTILTPLACANIVAELVKCILYEKSQIPYPFIYLKKAITKKRHTQISKNDEKPVSLTIQNHFRAASKAFDIALELLSNIEKELENSENSIKEIVILFGSTYYLPKEVFNIVIPRLEHHHNEHTHFNDTQKCVRNILRNILTSPEWKHMAEKSLPLTNMYILLKKSSQAVCSELFMPTDNFMPSPKVCQLEVKLGYNCVVESSCCRNDYDSVSDYFSEEVDSWYLANINIKGYKDVFVNKVSVSDLW